MEQINKTETRIYLPALEKGEVAEILGISEECQGDPRRRLLDLGFVKGTEIKILGKSPLGNPVAYRLKGTLIALRRDDAKHVVIHKIRNDE